MENMKSNRIKFTNVFRFGRNLEDAEGVCVGVAQPGIARS